MQSLVVGNQQQATDQRQQKRDSHRRKFPRESHRTNRPDVFQY
jgi:hypothetical protein